MLKCRILFMKKLISLISVVAFLAFAGSSFASYSNPCEPVYGGGYGGAGNCFTAGNILINKTVLNPQANKYQDNLGVNDPRYGAGQMVTFQLMITNIGNSTIDEAITQDNLPGYIEQVSGAGSFDENTRVLSFKIKNLAPNESKVYTVLGRVVSANKLPTQDVTCVVNHASVYTNDNRISQDSSQFCIEKTARTTKGGLPVMSAPGLKQTPSTGPEMLGLIGLIPAGLAGLLLRRKSK